MIHKAIDAYVSIISARRPDRVEKMHKLVGEATWFVAKGDGQAYRQAGARSVVESGALCRSRNAALDAAFKAGVPCVELSDDMSSVKEAYVDGGKKRGRPLPFYDAVLKMLAEGAEVGAFLSGVAPTANAYFFRPERPTSTNLFIVGDFIVVRPCALRFDEDLPLKEDYDYTLQHLTEYGQVARCNRVLATFSHRSNSGGAVSYRTAKLEQAVIMRLKEKWPGKIVDNPRRPNEVLMRWPKKGETV